MTLPAASFVATESIKTQLLFKLGLENLAIKDAAIQGDNPEALVLQLDGPFDQKTGGKGANVARAVDLARSVGGRGRRGSGF